MHGMDPGRVVVEHTGGLTYKQGGIEWGRRRMTRRRTAGHEEDKSRAGTSWTIRTSGSLKSGEARDTATPEESVLCATASLEQAGQEAGYCQPTEQREMGSDGTETTGQADNHCVNLR